MSDADKPISTLYLGLRIEHALKREGIKTLFDLVQKTKKEVLKIPDIGKESLEVIEFRLNEVNLKLKDKK